MVILNSTSRSHRPLRLMPPLSKGLYYSGSSTGQVLAGQVRSGLLLGTGRSTLTRTEASLRCLTSLVGSRRLPQGALLQVYQTLMK
jgi:hypothetical protein